MNDTGFQVPAAKLDRLRQRLHDGSAEEGARASSTMPRNSRWSKPPPFAAGGGGPGLDRRRLSRLLSHDAEQGPARRRAHPVAAAVELMTSDQLTPEQKQGAELFFGHGASWGMGGAVVTRRTDLCATPGRFGWDGGYGTSAHLDPAEDMVGILMTQRMMDSPAAAARVPRFLDVGLPGDRRLSKERSHERAALSVLRRPRPGSDRLLQGRDRRQGRHGHALQGRAAGDAGRRCRPARRTR